MREILLLSVVVYAIYNRPPEGYSIVAILSVTALFFIAMLSIKDRLDARNNTKTGRRTSVRK